MADYKLAKKESKFADIIWENEPLSSAELVRLSEEGIDWKKSTTYTILRRLCDREIFKNENTIVSSVISRDEFYAYQSRRIVEETFEGSLPSFLKSFFHDKKLSEEQAEELVNLINGFKGE